MITKPKDKEERDPKLPTSVPMPSAVEDITDAGMRAMWDAPPAAEPEEPTAELVEA